MVFLLFAVLGSVVLAFTYSTMETSRAKQQSTVQIIEARDVVFKTLRNNTMSAAAIRKSITFAENSELRACVTSACSVNTSKSPAAFAFYTSNGVRLTATSSTPNDALYSSNGTRCARNPCTLSARSYFVAICDNGRPSPCTGVAHRIEFHVSVESASNSSGDMFRGQLKARSTFGNVDILPHEQPSPVIQFPVWIVSP